jgi:hypothetical protein
MGYGKFLYSRKLYPLINFDPLFSPFGHAKQELQHLGISQFWPKLQKTTARKPLMGYGNKQCIKKINPLINF